MPRSRPPEKVLCYQDSAGQPFGLTGRDKTVLAQSLRPRADGEGRILACEVCIATPAVHKRIREGEPHLGRKPKMQTMGGVLTDLYQRGEPTICHCPLPPLFL
jgi:Tfp pilus assembly pilus retraction ATPase PilT